MAAALRDSEGTRAPGAASGDRRGSVSADQKGQLGTEWRRGGRPDCEEAVPQEAPSICVERLASGGEKGKRVRPRGQCCAPKSRCACVVQSAHDTLESMTAHYVNCFVPGDSAEKPLSNLIASWSGSNIANVSHASVQDPNALKQHLEGLALEDLKVLIIGGHGDASLTGFWVQNDPLRWHDLAFLLRGRLSKDCSFVFYSCNGGYPGIMHLFGRNSGPDFVFGPRISVFPSAMTHAVDEILKWKDQGSCTQQSSIQLVDGVNSWAGGQYPNDPDHQQFLRVMWCEGSNCRHPDIPGEETPVGPTIPLLGWGL